MFHRVLVGKKFEKEDRVDRTERESERIMTEKNVSDQIVLLNPTEGLENSIYFIGESEANGACGGSFAYES